MGSAIIGYTAILISALGFGSNYVPVKRCETGNGIAFQFFFCVAVWLCGLALGWNRGFPTTPPIAMLGGCLWASGNMLSVPAIKLIGMSMSILIWGSSNMIMGWASGTFGLFHLQARPASNILLNYAGVGVAILALVFYLFVKPEDPQQQEGVGIQYHDIGSSSSLSSSLSHRHASKEHRDGPLLLLQRPLLDPTAALDSHGADVFIPHLTGKKRLMLGSSLALLAGVFYGTSFDPSTAVIDHSSDVNSSYYGYSSSTLDYVYPHFCGILLTSFSYFFIYLLYMALCRNEAPDIYPSTILPSFVSGFLWALAMIAWFVSNSELMLAITFPITTSTPGLIASLWGVLIFKEIRGTRNLVILGCAFGLTILACVIIAFSM